MTVKLSVDDARATSQIVEAWTSRLLDVLSDLRVAWRMVGAKVQEHIAERWGSDYAQLAPLSPSTQRAKALAIALRAGKLGFAKDKRAAERAAKKLQRDADRARARYGHFRDFGLDDGGAQSFLLAWYAQNSHRSAINLRGYYQTKKPGSASYLRQGGGHAFWWTGKALSKALNEGAFDAREKSLRFDFGRDSEPRRNLERMHFGGETRPPRPVYDIDRVRQIADEWVNKFVDRVLSSTSVDQQVAFRR